MPRTRRSAQPSGEEGQSQQQTTTGETRRTMPFTLDFTKPELQDAIRGLKPLPDGNYPATLEEGVEGVSKEGNPTIKVTYKLTADAPAGAGRTVIKDYSMLPRAVWRFINDMVALGGIDADDVEGNSAFVPMAAIEANRSRKGLLQLEQPNGDFSNNNLARVRPYRG